MTLIIYVYKPRRLNENLFFPKNHKKTQDFILKKKSANSTDLLPI